MSDLKLCAGSAFVEFGHAYRECPRRKTCERARLFDECEKAGTLDKRRRIGWKCSDDSYAEYIRARAEEQLDFFGGEHAEGN